MSYDSNPSSEEFSLKEYKELLLKMRDLEEENNKLKEDIKKWKHSKNKLDDEQCVNRVVKMAIDFIDYHTGKQIMVEQTDVACWWCTERFESMPCFIPEKCVNGTYYVWGNFCSYNCAASHNFELNDYKSWNRYSLMKRLYNKIYSNHDEIRLADVPTSLKKFGGSQTIEEFRLNSRTNKKEYRFLMPPMVSVIPMLEENYTDHVGYKTNAIQADNNLILKRNKPLPHSKSTLMESMGIIRKKQT
jgi:hypothetical protein